MEIGQGAPNTKFAQATPALHMLQYFTPLAILFFLGLSKLLKRKSDDRLHTPANPSAMSDTEDKNESATASEDAGVPTGVRTSSTDSLGFTPFLLELPPGVQNRNSCSSSVDENRKLHDDHENSKYGVQELFRHSDLNLAIENETDLLLRKNLEQESVNVSFSRSHHIPHREADEYHNYCNKNLILQQSLVTAMLVDYPFSDDVRIGINDGSAALEMTDNVTATSATNLIEEFNSHTIVQVMIN